MASSHDARRAATHYDLLGVPPTATTADIRAAYRRAAREHHPDAHGDGSADRMAAINDAWWVLRDPGRRQLYDSSIRAPERASAAGAAAASGPGSVAQPDPSEPRFNPLARYQDPPRFPWRLMVVLAAVGAGVVLLGVATYEAPAPSPPDNVLTGGSCVSFEDNGDAREVSCEGAYDGVVDALVGDAAQCAIGTEPHRDRQGMGIACVRLGAHAP